MNENKKFNIFDYVSFREIEDEILILNLKTDMFYILSNETSKVIWYAINNNKNLHNIIQKILEKYNIRQEKYSKIKTDVVGFIEDLINEKIISNT